MILKSDEFRKVAQTIAYAIDNKDVSLLTETLELEASGTTLHLNVTNREYYCSVAFNLSEAATLKATVNAKLFLNLISKITTDTVELKVIGNSLNVIANGEYTLPMIYNNDKLLELTKINIDNVTNTMNINGSTLLSILNSNSKELQRGIPVKPVQKYYYVDELGAITFTSGACVNSFTLDKKVKVLLSDKVVKLFKLFKDDNSVSFTLGQDALSDDLVQTKVRFSTNKVELTAKLPDSNLITSVPVDAIRGMASKDYAYSIVLDRALLLQSLNRVMLFNNDKTYGNITVSNNVVKIEDYDGESKEELMTTNDVEGVDYKMTLDLNGLKLILDGCDDTHVTMAFGDHKAVVIRKTSVNDIIPEMRVN